MLGYSTIFVNIPLTVRRTKIQGLWYWKSITYILHSKLSPFTVQSQPYYTLKGLRLPRNMVEIANRSNACRDLDFEY